MCMVNPQRGLADEAITNDQRAGLKPAPTTAPTRYANGRDPATSNRANTADRAGGSACRGGFETRPYNGTDTLREGAGSGDFEPREYSRPFWRSACRGGFRLAPTTAPTRCANGRDPATSNRANTADRAGGAHVGAGLDSTLQWHRHAMRTGGIRRLRTVRIQQTVLRKRM